MFSNPDLNGLLAIMLAALVTYSLRAGGLLLAEKLPQTGKFKKAMNVLPGTILISLVTPSIFAAGPIGVLATCLTAAITYFTKNVFLGMLIGVGLVALKRNLAG